jgi:predicted nucleic acid-binding protein
MRRVVFDRLGFELFLATLKLSPAVRISATTMRKARRRIEQAPRAAERDLEDAVYLACAVDGEARLITTEDSDLRSLGDEYESVRILSWDKFRDHLRMLGLLTARTD